MNLELIKTKNDGNLRALIYMADCFRKRNLPLKHIGKITLEVTEGFWQNETFAKLYIEKYCDILADSKKKIDEEFGEDSAEIFSDYIQKNVFRWLNS